MRANLIRTIPAGKDAYGNQLPHYFTKYEFKCIDCGAHYRSGHCDSRTIPYCNECRRKHDIEKQKAKKEQKQRELEALKEDICDRLCRYPEKYRGLYKDPDEAHEVMVNECCTECPLERLNK